MRSLRRHHKFRLRNKRKYYYENTHIKYTRDYSCSCSCAICGNPRKHFGEKTIQERRNDE